MFSFMHLRHLVFELYKIIMIIANKKRILICSNYKHEKILLSVFMNVRPM